LDKKDIIRDLAKLNIVHLSQQIDCETENQKIQTISRFIINFRMIAENPVFNNIEADSFMEYLLKEAENMDVNVLNWVAYRKYKLNRIYKDL
jgi:hypothetical protein